MFEFLEYFSADYPTARSRFRAAVAAVGGHHAQYRHPHATGAEGEELTIDIGHIGDRSGERQLVLISGTHGLEGFAGSALQTGWLSRHAAAGLPPGIGVLLVHGLNPYGFSHGSRTTLAGIDLNRNFVDHTQPRPANAGYEALHPHLVPAQWAPQALARAQDAIAAFGESHGPDALFDALARGQYSRPEGVFYGGTQPEWENETLKRITQAHLHAARKIAVIDCHTGIGEYGRPFFLVFNDAQSPEFAQAARWWGQARVDIPRPHGHSVPRYQGLVVQGVQSFLPDRAVVAAVIEFGTRGAEAGGIAIRQDHWLRLHGEDLDPDARAQLKSDLLDSLNPVSYEWRDAVLRHGLDIVDSAVSGLAVW